LSLLTIVQRAARQCGLTPPSSVLGSGDETWLQMAEWAQETVDDLAQRHDWRALWQTQTLTGDGVITSWTITDFARLSKLPAVARNASTSGFWPHGPLDSANWIAATQLPITSVRPFFQMVGSLLTFNTPPASGETFTVSYQSSKPIYSSAAASNVTEWAADADTARIPERLVMLGTVWRWKMSKGLDYSEFLSSSERLFESLSSADWGLAPLELAATGYVDEFGEPRVTV